MELKEMLLLGVGIGAGLCVGVCIGRSAATHAAIQKYKITLRQAGFTDEEINDLLDGKIVAEETESDDDDVEVFTGDVVDNSNTKEDK